MNRNHDNGACRGDMTEPKKSNLARRNVPWTVETSEYQTDLPCYSSTMIADQIAPPSIDLSSMTSMSFATLQVAECRPREGDKEIDKKTFGRWKDKLEAAMDFAGIKSEAMRWNAFKMKAGSTLLDMLEFTSPSDATKDGEIYPFSNAMERLDKYYSSHDYVFIQRQKLRSLDQGKEEADSTYVKRVIELAKLCNFQKDQMIETVVDVIQTHASNATVRALARKTLRKRGSILELMDRVRSCEFESKNEQAFARNHSQSVVVGEVAAVSYGSLPGTSRSGVSRPVSFARENPSYRSNQQYSRQGSSRGTTRPSTGRFSGTLREPCWRCLSTFHSSNNCHAADKRCRNCQTMGHIERACRSNPRDMAKRRLEERDESSHPMKAQKIAAITSGDRELEGSNREHDAITLHNATEKETHLTNTLDEHIKEGDSLLAVDHRGEVEGSIVGYVAGIPVIFLIDSGADVNTIDENNFNRLTRKDSGKCIFSFIHGTDRPLKAYGVLNEIPVIASFVAELYISEHRPHLMEKIYVIPNARPLLSRSTAMRYSVLQLGLGVPIKDGINQTRLLPGEILALRTDFPKFKVAHVMLAYNKDLPPSRNVFTSIPPAFREETERRISDLLSAGIIERVTEHMEKSFCSSLLVVPKGKTDIRLVVDLRGPNRSIIRAPFSMPTLEEILAKLNGASCFSTIDLTSAFFHVELHEDCRHLTNFFAGNGTYRFKRLPFGLCNSPDIFQEILQTVVLEGCSGALNYLDDILVYGSSKEGHDKNLKDVLQRLREHNVRLNDSKCRFGASSVKFLVFNLSKDGWRVEEDKRKAIENARRPETVSEVKSFLGLMNFTERFILNRAEKTERLRSLAKSDCFYWTEEEEEEFSFLKNAALNDITRLGYFDHKDETELFADASPIGLGAVLTQFDSTGRPRIKACASKALTAAEQRYPHTQKEALAIVW
uniref:Reverse transcriptase domain-containing protein n=1 Tax=Anopheles atroparvus TaxID=41427 RepID=A0AAG5D2X2_ANOAO